MQCIPSFNNDNGDAHHDDKATNANQIDDYDCRITFNIQQLTESFHTALPRCCNNIRQIITILLKI